MNIFVIDEDPKRSAMQLNDKHIVKMVVEQAQMLSTTRLLFKDKTLGLYKPCFINHPCTKWVRESLDNYRWSVIHFKALCEEYTYRYYKVHKTMSLLPLFTKELKGIPDIGLTKFATAMPDKNKVEDSIQSYRNYYLGEKILNKIWTNRKKEELDYWLSSNLKDEQFKRN